MAQVTLLCQGLRRDPPDATVEQYLQGLDTPGAFAADVGPPKTAPPNPVDHDRISKEVQQNYGPEYRKAQTDQQKKAFAEGILNAARSTTDPKDPATRFVLLEWVSRLAAEAHDGALGGEAIEARAAEFQGVDVLAEQWQLCDALVVGHQGPAGAASARAATALVRECGCGRGSLGVGPTIPGRGEEGSAAGERQRRHRGSAADRQAGGDDRIRAASWPSRRSAHWKAIPWTRLLTRKWGDSTAW